MSERSRVCNLEFSTFLISKSFSELQRRLDLSKKQLQDSERQLSEADAKNFDLSMNISNLVMFYVASFNITLCLHLC